MVIVVSYTFMVSLTFIKPSSPPPPQKTDFFWLSLYAPYLKFRHRSTSNVSDLPYNTDTQRTKAVSGIQSKTLFSFDYSL